MFCTTLNADVKCWVSSSIGMGISPTKTMPSMGDCLREAMVRMTERSESGVT